MLGGERVSDGIRASAREMLVGRRKAKAKGESEKAERDKDTKVDRGHRGKSGNRGM